MKITVYRRSFRSLQACSATQLSLQHLSLSVVYDTMRLYQKIIRDPYLPLHHRTKSIYVHVPKTGGNSVTQMLYGERSPKAGSHRGAWEYKNYSAELFSQYFVFATVRHPLTRLHSAFHYLKCGGINAKDKRWGEQYLHAYDTFYDFILALRNPTYRRIILRGLHFMPQSYFLCDVSGKLIVDNFVRLEDFENGMQKVCDKLNISYKPHRNNITPGRKITPEDFSDIPAKICYEIYPQDYALLGYDL